MRCAWRDQQCVRKSVLWLALAPVIAANLCLADDQESPPLLLRSIDSLSNPLDSLHTSHVVLRGVVTLVRKQIVYLQDQTGAVAVVPPEEASRLAIGDEVELQGEYRRRKLSPAVYATTIRRLWSGSPPVPLSLTPEQAAEGTFGNRLIDTEGRLLQKILGDGYLRLTFEGERQFFGASLELSSPIRGSRELAKTLAEGSTLRLVGVCVPSAGSEEAGGSAFLVLLRSTDDIRVVSPPPWWNLKHAVWLGCASLALLVFVYLLRHRALNLRYQAIVEERGRIAREMHDSLAQGFSGLTYQLEGIARELNSPHEENSLEQHIGMALQLVRHCREEAHRSIFALRSLTQTDPDLLTLLMSCCDSLPAGGRIRFATVREGKPAPISDETMNHLLRIGQEAITNALRHASASEIVIAVRFDTGRVTLSVSDNGRGFDLASAESAETGHFGILGMKERARHIAGQIEILSRPGQGTMVTAHAPAARGRSLRSPLGSRRGWLYRGVST